MVGWHHRLNGHKFEQTPGNGEGQGSLACCSPWDLRVRHDRATEQQQIHYRAFAKFAGYLPPHRGCPDKQGLASGKAPSSLQGSDPLQCPRQAPHPILLLYGETRNGRGSLPFKTMKQNPPSGR